MVHMTIIERIARVLAGERLSANAGGSEASAGDLINSQWQSHVQEAIAVIKALRDPDEAMVGAGDKQVWQSMIDRALERPIGKNDAPNP